MDPCYRTLSRRLFLRLVQDDFQEEVTILTEYFASLVILSCLFGYLLSQNEANTDWFLKVVHFIGGGLVAFAALLLLPAGILVWLIFRPQIEDRQKPKSKVLA